MNKAERQVAVALARDCVSFKLSYEVGKKYIADRLPKDKDGKTRTISDTTYWRLCKEAEADPQNQQWLMDHTKEGFVRVHREQMQAMEIIQRDLVTLYIQEMQRPERASKEEKKAGKRVRSYGLLMGLAAQIRENSKRIQELNEGVPTVQNMKAVVDIAVGAAKEGKLGEQALQELVGAIGVIQN